MNFKQNIFSKLSGKSFLLLFVFHLPFSIFHLTYGQQHPLYSQYMFNRMAINPAYAGSKNALSTTLLLRNQWVGIDGAPTTQTLTVHSPINSKKIGLGLSVFGDQIGPRKMTGVAGTYSYRITLPQGKLAMGVRFGFYQYVYNWALIDHLDNGDPVYGQTTNRFYVPSADAGIYFHNDKLFAGVSSTQMLNGRITDVKTANGDNAHLVPHFFVIAGYGFEVKENVVLNPGFSLRTAQGSPVNVDVNFNAQFHKKFWLGVSYRSRFGIVLLSRFAITEKMNIGYSFDYGLDPLTRNTFGSHEIVVEYNFRSLSKSKVLSPRYFYF